MVSIGLLNPKSASNVAVILRASGCFGVNLIQYTGTRYTFAKAFHEDTKRMRDKIPTVSVDDLIESTPKSAVIVAVELTEGACPLPEFIHPECAYYVFGPEDGSLSQSIIDKADHVVYIPTSTSLNLGVTANIVLYDRLAKSKKDFSLDTIAESRDVNNNTKVK